MRLRVERAHVGMCPIGLLLTTSRAGRVVDGFPFLIDLSLARHCSSVPEMRIANDQRFASDYCLKWRRGRGTAKVVSLMFSLGRQVLAKRGHVSDSGFGESDVLGQITRRPTEHKKHTRD